MALEAMPAARAIAQLRIADMVALALSCAASLEEVGDALAPLLSRRLPVNWHRLISAELPASQIVRVAGALADELQRCDPWSLDAVQRAVERAAFEPERDPEPVRQLLVICLLFDASALPLVPAIEILGRAESTRRLRTVAGQLQAMQLVG